MMEEEHIFTEAQMKEYARKTATSIERQENAAAIIALEGELGAGKTTFAKAFAEAFGVQETVVSPTFILERVYDLPESATQFKRLIHIDAYRLENEKELHQLGWDEIVQNSENIILIEWADRVPSAIPKRATWIVFEYMNETTRRVRTH